MKNMLHYVVGMSVANLNKCPAGISYIMCASMCELM